MAERQWDILYHDSLEVEKGVPEREVVRRAKEGRLGLDDCLRRTGTEEWRRVADFRKLAELVRAVQAKQMAEAQEPVAAEPVPAEGEGQAAAVAATEARTQEAVAQTAALEPIEDEGEQLAFRPPRTADVPVDLTPMVDVTFQLLLFFMLTATFTLQKSLEMPKPAEEKGTRTLQQILNTTIMIEIDRNNAFWVDDQKVDESELVRRLVQIRRTENKTAAIVQPHERASVEAIVKALDAAQEAGIENVMLTAPKRAPRQRQFFQRRRSRAAMLERKATVRWIGFC